MSNLLTRDYVRRWRTVCMLNNIKLAYNRKDPNLSNIIDNYIKFAKEINENEWEKKYK